MTTGAPGGPGHAGAAPADPLVEAVARIRGWGEARAWQGYDPYDGLNSPLARLVPGVLPRRLLTQAVKLSPLNLRPLLGIRPAYNQKAIGLVASAYARLGEREQATRWLDWLCANRADPLPGSPRPAPGAPAPWAWAYNFPVQTRVFAYPPNSANTIATSFVAHAFLDAADCLGAEAAARWEEPIRGTCAFLLDSMLVEQPGRCFFRYIPGDDQLIHNATTLAAAVLARAARVYGDPALADPAHAAIRPTLAAQADDGTWPYAEGTHAWVDNFHTGYVLMSLAHFPEAADPLRRGVAVWERELFLADGTPKYYAGSLYPIDAHCYAQAVETWVSVRDLAAARREAELMVARMLDPRGFLWFQQRGRITSKVPFVRWTTAPALQAIAGLLRAEGKPAP